MVDRGSMGVGKGCSEFRIVFITWLSFSLSCLYLFRNPLTNPPEYFNLTFQSVGGAEYYEYYETGERRKANMHAW